MLMLQKSPHAQGLITELVIIECLCTNQPSQNCWGMSLWIKSTLFIELSSGIFNFLSFQAIPQKKKFTSESVTLSNSYVIPNNVS